MLPELGPEDPAAIRDIRDALVIREGDQFLLTDSQGNIAPGNRGGFGLYHHDCRYLSGWHLTLVDLEPIMLLSTAELGFSMEQVMINPELVNDLGETLAAGSFDIRRQRVIDNALLESVMFTNRALVPLEVTLQYEFDADFADIFVIRGVKPAHRGRLSAIRVHGNGVTFRYSGADGVGRHTRVRFRPAPDELESHKAVFRLEVAPGERREISAVVLADAIAGTASARRSIESISVKHASWKRAGADVATSNDLLNAALDRSLSDLRMLWSGTAKDQRYLSAGVPWFNTLFGRDSALAALMFLAFRPDVGAEVLRSLAGHQGRTVDVEREEEPGKIIHELRECESANTGEVVFGRYYGSIDSTPLFLMLAAEYHRWTDDMATITELLPAIDAALAWMETYGDVDGDGYLEYRKQSAGGLDNQGWKDSWDGIIDEAGEPLAPPVTLVEVQGYVYAAKQGMARVFDALGDGVRARRLRSEARELRRRINTSFWTPRGFYALALDAAKRPVEVVSSNGGQLLFTGVPTRARATQQVRRLMGGDMFSGWGIRTLSSGARRYNPMGYHVGSIWPHDNALIIAGLKRYGAEPELETVATALCQAAFAFPYYRLPELFSGAPRQAHQAPVPYPVACRPQAWAAAAIPFALVSMLGLVPDAQANRLHVVRPRLPGWLESVRVSGLRVGRSTVDLTFHRADQRTTLEVGATSGPIEVVRSERWPNASEGKKVGQD